MKPFIEDIESFKLINAEGEIVHCSRVENKELFRLAVGGYGLFGIVLSVTLRLTKRQKLERIVKIETVENFRSFSPKESVGDLLSAIFNLPSPLKQMIFCGKEFFPAIVRYPTKFCQMSCKPNLPRTIGKIYCS